MHYVYVLLSDCRGEKLSIKIISNINNKNMLCIYCISTCATLLLKKNIWLWIRSHAVFCSPAFSHTTNYCRCPYDLQFLLIYSFYPFKQNDGALLLLHTELLLSVLLYTCLVLGFLCFRMKQKMKIIVFQSVDFICESALSCYVPVHLLLIVSSLLSQAIWLWNSCNTAFDLTGYVILNIHQYLFLPPHLNLWCDREMEALIPIP